MVNTEGSSLQHYITHSTLLVSICLAEGVMKDMMEIKVEDISADIFIFRHQSLKLKLIMKLAREHAW